MLEFDKLIELKEVHLFDMANKQDLEGAQNRNYACEYFGLVFTREG